MTLAFPETVMLSWSSSEAAQPREVDRSVIFSFPYAPESVPGPLSGEHGGFAVVPVTVPLSLPFPIAVPVPAPLARAVTVCPSTFSVTLPA